jgi:hypothetical protein
VGDGFRAVRTDLVALSTKLDEGLIQMSLEVTAGSARALQGLTELRMAASEVQRDVSNLLAWKEPPTAQDVVSAVNLSLRPLTRAVRELQNSAVGTSSALEAVAADLEQTRVTRLYEVRMTMPHQSSINASSR